jgi:hypothetical protein
VRIDGSKPAWQVQDERALENTLAWRDPRGGGEFWLSHERQTYPVLGLGCRGRLVVDGRTVELGEQRELW